MPALTAEEKTRRQAAHTQIASKVADLEKAEAEAARMIAEAEEALWGACATAAHNTKMTWMEMSQASGIHRVKLSERLKPMRDKAQAA